jgi:hypothetical protein
MANASRQRSTSTNDEWDNGPHAQVSSVVEGEGAQLTHIAQRLSGFSMC